ncbi:UDP-N-acetylmuramoyl-tripeptide--D-alanyl-D- alanine ligase [Bifidobacterium tsurumiense]|uniref:UDP-N-acetylmuramoyl-tripeptide--D-alanyl-D-alanine ligase n=2 Tax=Bifidobacterium tsurumiense TaxID=356829 RepID=A0A087EJT2_9BIFI|nr:UDP-N-acetylmuramoyl-tripeptide--D-alanyl-D- alanine ligase [Bifidobacterium tsurumiense]
MEPSPVQRMREEESMNTEENAAMMPMSVGDVAHAVQGELRTRSQSDADAIITSAVTDSRQIRSGSVFVAIKGERVDGHDFVAGAGEAGAVAALVEHLIPDVSIPQILVHNSVAALGLLAQRNVELRRASAGEFTIIGITGSVGKTTTKDMLFSLLSSLGPTVAPVGSFNNEIGLPLTALQVGEHTRFLVAEMGANHIGEIAHLTRIAPPDIAVVLKVGVAHLGEFGSVEHIAQAKSEIVRGLVPGGIAVLNGDDERVAAMAPLSDHVLWFGLGDAHEGVKAGNIQLDGLGRPAFDMETKRGGIRVQLGIGGEHNVMNALAAATVALECGMSLEQVALGLQSLHRISPHRMAVSTVTRRGTSFTLIDDSFNANPDSMRAGINGMMAWQGNDTQTQPYKVAVLGAMLELGDDAERLHKEIGAYAVQSGVRCLIAVGSESDAQFDAWAGAMSQGGSDAAQGDTNVSVHWVHNTEQADELVCDIAREHPNTVVLLKGSHFSGLSTLAEHWENE